MSTGMLRDTSLLEANRDSARRKVPLRLDEDVDCNSSCSESTMDSSGAVEVCGNSHAEGAWSHPPSPDSVMPPTPTIEQEVALNDAKSTPGAVASAGSALHGAGNCKPCAWFWKPQGCHNGADCTRCHLCPPGEIKSRKKEKLALLRATQAEDQKNSEEQKETEEKTDSPELQEKVTNGPVPGLDTKVEVAAQILEPNEPLLPPSTSFSRPLANFASGSITMSPLESPEMQWRLPPGLNTSRHLPPVPPPLVPPVLPSIGSVLHGSGKCRPCADFCSGRYCFQGRACQSCHLCDVVELRALEKAQMAGITISLDIGVAAPVAPPAPPASVMVASSTMPFTSSASSQESQIIGNLKPPKISSRFPSKGSSLHTSGGCSPCAWFWKPQGCQNGSNCGRCHLCTPGEVKARKKAKAAALRSGALQPKDGTGSGAHKLCLQPLLS
eukprot:TRINITY_DN41023_c0_g1_i1.p1 TRINITY_DN41023_c0_g1~~TRINITY_DN41023_c0_g1_i1.p1  ORF type:complete len:441 (+),score=87.13 TRINITY_DN41023_c0_g1_i1:94-1416(+)